MNLTSDNDIRSNFRTHKILPRRLSFKCASVTTEFKADLQAAVDHPVDCISSTTTNSYDLDPCIPSCKIPVQDLFLALLHPKCLGLTEVVSESKN